MKRTVIIKTLNFCDPHGQRLPDHLPRIWEAFTSLICNINVDLYFPFLTFFFEIVLNIYFFSLCQIGFFAPASLKIRSTSAASTGDIRTLP